MSGTFTVKLWGDRPNVALTGRVMGDFGVNRRVLINANGEPRESSKRCAWVVTHIPTGLAVCGDVSKEKANRLLRVAATELAGDIAWYAMSHTLTGEVDRERGRKIQERIMEVIG